MNSLLAVQLVGVGGALGALLRYGAYAALPTDEYPFATLLVNVLGSFLLGVVTFGGAGEGAALFVGVGVCGAFTTYSSFSVDVVRLWERGRPTHAAVHAVGNLALSLLAVGVAWLLVELVV
ncbi:Integral membrane protein [Halalkaliarchaeum sp. AArc-CO]|uniref:fluoride efflux transporter CrcB n=1 Tax=Halalkaliarchaeum sp. AArc-CO TaxID=2866381 RepID=UPI00217E65FF|nr:fluoride efflux transporter CrcB [Halalkaliarchaeum sp. AArc-CO]UWG51940.1 Integral membrane protein [Halalkaliarchaeum sp. AArc-CO]